MVYEQVIWGTTKNARGKLGNTEFVIRIDTLALTLSGRDLGGDFEEQLADFAALEAAYQRRAAGIFDNKAVRDSSCTEGGPIEDLGAYLEELEACGFTSVATPLDPDDPLEVAVTEFCQVLRRELNRALGPDPARVDSIVLCTDDASLHVAYLNCPVFTGLSDEQIAVVADDGRWEREAGPGHRRLPLPISHEDLIVAPEDWDDQSFEFLSAFLDLVDVRLEAKPGLRANIEHDAGLRFLHTIHEDIWFSAENRARAREYVDQPAGEYFERLAVGTR